MSSSSSSHSASSSSSASSSTSSTGGAGGSGGSGGAGNAPPGWTCDPAYYGDKFCDCGCAVVDSDCADATAASCEGCEDPGSCGLASCPGNINATNNAVCDPVICGDGKVGPGEECDDGNTANGDGCDSKCQWEVPAAWTCNPDYYGSGDGCDCGCGIKDPDCADATVASCVVCSDAGSCGKASCNGNINPTNNATCVAPAGCGNGTVEAGEECDDGNTTNGDGCNSFCEWEAWKCSHAYYGTNDGCDCGCGVKDPDCSDLNVTSCSSCTDAGSCGNGTCPANINPTNNAVCQ